MKDVIVLGGLNMDLIVETPRLAGPGETAEGSRFYTTPGGKGGNQAVAAARLAESPGTVKMVGRIGDDGFGEEMAYRGYALTALVLATGSATLALIVTSATFGVLHAYQGPIGVVRTGVVGVIMGAAFLHTGSLWPPIFAHALIDLVAGLILKERLLS